MLPIFPRIGQLHNEPGSINNAEDKTVFQFGATITSP